MTRRILQSIALDKIAAVDNPCQEHAVASILKRRQEPDLNKIDDSVIDLLVKQLPEDDFIVAMEKLIGCKDWEKPEGVQRLLPVLKHSLDSIGDDQGKVRETVGQFLTEVQKQYPDSMPLIETSIMAKRQNALRTNMLALKISLLQKAWTDAARLASAEARKKHSAAATAHAQHHKSEAAKQSSPAMKEGHLKISRQYQLAASHFDAGNTKQGFHHFETAANMYGHPSAYLSELRDSVTGNSPRRIKLKKAWTDAARAASAESRKTGKKSQAAEARQKALSHREKAKAHSKIFTGLHPYPRSFKDAKRQAEAGNFHSHLARMYGQAAKHFAAGRKQAGGKLMGFLKPVSERAHAHSDKIIKPLNFLLKVIGNTAGDYIHDFVNSNNKKFKNDSKQQRIRRALGAYYAAQ